MHRYRLRALIPVVCLIILMATDPATATPTFRDYKEDRDRLESYINKAKDADSAAQWETIVSQGKAALTAGWEKDAQAEIDKALTGKEDDAAAKAELEQDRSEAYAEWETLVNEEVVNQEGKWLAARENILYTDFDRVTLADILTKAEKSLSVAEWDSLVDPVENQIGVQWEKDLKSTLDAVRAKNLTLDAKLQQSYLTAIDDMELKIKDEFRFEKNTLIYRARNKFITDLMLDTESLRKISEAESGSAIADAIIADTEEALAKEEDKLLADATTDEGAGELDPSKLGEDWEAELSRLLERGMKTWQDALDRLYADMKAWRSGAQQAFEDGDEEWRSAYEKLYNARDAWQQRIQKEVQEGIDKWQEREDSLKINLDRARKDFDTYADTMNDQWLKHSLGLAEMNLNGARIYGESLENIQWLQEMIQRYQGKAAYENNSQDLYDAVDATTGNWFTAAKNKVTLNNPNGTFDPTNWWWAIGLSFGSYEFHYEWLETNAECVDKTWSDNNRVLTETYRITVYKHTYARVKTGSGGSGGLFGNSNYQTINQVDVVDTLVWENRMTDTSGPEKRKSSWYIYTRELARWNDMKETMAGIISDSELTMHDKNMLGTDGGPGFLVSDGTEGDPYLMTDAEREYRLAIREREYFKKRMDIALAVKEYAETLGKREDAASTIAKKENTEKDMVTAKGAYESQLKAISDIVNELKVIQGEKPADMTDDAAMDAYRNTIAGLTEELEKRQAELAKADETFQTLRRALIVLENGEDADFVAKEIQEIERSLVQKEREIRNKSVEYYTRAREFDYAARAGSYAALYRDAVTSREEAKDSYELFHEALTGEEKESNIAVWVDTLNARKDAIWGDAAEARYKAINDARSVWEAAAGEDRTKAYASLTRAIHDEYARLYAAYELADRQYRLITDEDFNAYEYLQNKNPFDAGEYEGAATISRDAFSLIDDAMETIVAKGTDKTGDNLIAALKQELDKYSFSYGDENREYLVRWAAYRFAATSLAGLTDAGWEEARKQLSDEEDAAEAIATLYGDYRDFDPADVRPFADQGIKAARNLLFEYYNRGTSLTLLSFLQEKDAHLAVTDTLEKQVYSFVQEHRDILPWAENETKGITATDLITYVNDHNAGFTLSEDNLDSLGMDELGQAADLVRAYARERQEAGLPVPRFLTEFSSRIDTARRTLLALGFAGENADMVGAEAYLADAEKEQARIDAALRFMDSAGTMLSGGSPSAAEGLDVLSKYEVLDASVKQYLNKSSDAAVQSVLASLEEMRALRFSLVKRDLAAQFMDQGNGLTLDQFIAVNGTSLDDAEKLELKEYLAPYDEKRQYLAAGDVGSIEKYISDRKLAGVLADEVKAFILVDQFNRGTQAGDFTGLDALFAAYTKSGKLGDLPDTLQAYIAGNRYFDQIEAKGGYLFTAGDIDAFVTGQFGAEGISDGVRDLLDEYINGLGAAHRFYGGDADAYGKSLNDTKAGAFYATLYLGEDRGTLIRPFAGMGVYGLSTLLSAETALYSGKIAALAATIQAMLDDAGAAVGRDLEAAEEHTNEAKTLVKYQTSPEEFKSYRNYIETVTQKQGDGDDATETTVITAALGSGVNFLDTVSTDDTGVTTFLKGDETGGGSLGSMAMDAAKDLHRALSDLITAVKESSGDHTIESFLSRAGLIYDEKATYTKTGDTYAFTAGLADLVAEFDAVAIAAGSALSSLGEELQTLENSRLATREKLLSRGLTYRLMEGTDTNSVSQDFAQAATARGEAEAAYAAVQERLLAKQKEYQDKNNDYIGAMNDAAALYSSFQKAEYDYEKAYAVWEYAHTPYLDKESYGGSGDAPDAAENYQRMKAKYDAAALMAGTKESAYKNQETVADLLKDATYADTREKFQETAESSLRADMTDAILDENIAKLREDQEKARDKYQAALADLTANIFATADPITEDEKLLRDQLIEKMLENGSSMDAYLFAAQMKNDLMTGRGIEWAYGDDHVVQNFNYGNYFMTQHPDWATMNDTDKWIINTGSGRLNAYNYQSFTLDTSNPIFAWLNLYDRAAELQAKYKGYLTDKLSSLQEDINDLYESFTPSLINTMNSYYNTAVYYDLLLNNRCNSSGCRDRHDGYRDQRGINAQWFNVTRQGILDKFSALNKTATAYAAATDKLNATARARTLEELKNILGGEEYLLTAVETGRLYDGTVKDAPAGGINITALRKETARKDANGRAMKAVVESGKIYVVDILGNKIKRDGGYESFALDDVSVILRDGDGAKIDAATATGGTLYYFNDYTYNTDEVMSVLSGSIAKDRTSAKTAMESGIATGAHDTTAVLKDQEQLYWDLLNYAKTLGTDKGRVDQRETTSYASILAEYLYDGKGGSVQDKIVQALIAQNRAFQEQIWNQKSMQFTEKKDRWQEVVGYIVNRGATDWSNNLARMENEWRKWRFEAKETIEKGEKAWEQALGGFKNEMNSWRDRAALATADATSLKMYEDLSGTINDYVARLKKNLPDNVSFSINADKLLAEAMANAPTDTIGILSKAMDAVDTTVGFAKLFSLNLSSALQNRYDQEMQNYQKSMTVMKNLRVVDLLNEIIEQFNEQLEEQNSQRWDEVATTIRPSFMAPFNRETGTNQWSVRVLWNRLAFSGREYKTLYVTDYRDYSTDTVKLATLKGLNGQSIDFDDPNTYMNLDAGELDTYVRLEQDHLSEEIDKVLGNSGTFSGYVSQEYSRLSKDLEEADKDWSAGQKLDKAGFHRVQVWKGGPDVFTASRIVVSAVLSCCGPYGILAAALVNAACIAVDMAEGKINVNQGILQAGVSIGVAAVSAVVNVYTAGMGGTFLTEAARTAIQVGASTATTAASTGINYQADGGINFDFNKMGRAFKGGLFKMALSVGLATANMQGNSVANFIADTLGNNFNSRGNFWEISFDTRHLAQSATTALGNSIGVALGGLAGNPILAKMLAASASQLVNAGMHGLTGGAGMDDESTRFNWDAITYSHTDIGSDIGRYLGTQIGKATATDEAREAYEQMEEDQRNRDDKSFVERLKDFGLSFVNIFDSIAEIGGIVKNGFVKVGSLFSENDLVKKVKTTANNLYNKAYAEYEISMTKDKVNLVIDDVLEKYKNLKGENKFNAVVNELQQNFKDQKFYNEDHLSETYASIVERLADVFNRSGKDPITYGFKINLINKDGSISKTEKVDCTGLQSLVVNILGLAKDGGYNINEYNSKVYKYDEKNRNKEMLIKASTNFKYNTDLFDFIDINDVEFSNIRGTIGVTRLYKYDQKLDKEINFLDHVYTCLGKGVGIVDSSDNKTGLPNGIVKFKGKEANDWNIYKNRTIGFLKIKLFESRKTNLNE